MKKFLFCLLGFVQSCGVCQRGSILWLQIDNQSSQDYSISISPSYQNKLYLAPAQAQSEIAHGWECTDSSGHDSFWLRIKLNDRLCTDIHRTCDEEGTLPLTCDSTSCSLSNIEFVDC